MRERKTKGVWLLYPLLSGVLLLTYFVCAQEALVKELITLKSQRTARLSEALRTEPLLPLSKSLNVIAAACFQLMYGLWVCFFARVRSLFDECVCLCVYVGMCFLLCTKTYLYFFFLFTHRRVDSMPFLAKLTASATELVRYFYQNWCTIVVSCLTNFTDFNSWFIKT